MRDQALLAHATQVDPDGSWFPVPLEMQRRIWPTEDFELAPVLRARSTCREDDLFAGLGSPEEATELATSTGLQIAFDGTGDES